MKWYILLHNLVTMAQASVTNSVEGFSLEERRAIAQHIVDLIDDMDHITPYQANRLYDMCQRLIKEE